MIIRSAEPADLPRLQAIESAAGEIFRTVGMAAIADDEPPTVAELERFRQAGHAWVAADETGIVAYLVAEVVDGALHIEQVTVHPDAARRGVGQTLIACAADCARGQGLTGLTLTTFADVPWNAPYYERLGFRRLSGAELTPGLRAIRAAEAEHGLDRWPRVCMRRGL
ncbi:GNAT family N-acetyltransferase [Streptomyces sp. NPDC002790]|uniref:GNAT family N-acetyltransferase n=1 Tax=Streptomyces sp. NPDC002790 TaxID=3154431 RepID=UPI00332A894B